MHSQLKWRHFTLIITRFILLYSFCRAGFKVMWGVIVDAGILATLRNRLKSLDLFCWKGATKTARVDVATLLARSFKYRQLRECSAAYECNDFGTYPTLTPLFQSNDRSFRADTARKTISGSKLWFVHWFVHCENRPNISAYFTFFVYRSLRKGVSRVK